MNKVILANSVGDWLKKSKRKLAACLPARRVPVVLQMSAVECGAACLAMILSYYGRKTAITDCRECFAIGRDGVSARLMAKVARDQGLRVKAYTLEPDKFKFVPLPAIVHWNFNHFVVVESWTKQRVRLVDPAVGRYSVTAEEFDR